MMRDRPLVTNAISPTQRFVISLQIFVTLMVSLLMGDTYFGLVAILPSVVVIIVSSGTLLLQLTIAMMYSFFIVYGNLTQSGVLR